MSQELFKSAQIIANSAELVVNNVAFHGVTRTNSAAISCSSSQFGDLDSVTKHVGHHETHSSTETEFRNQISDRRI